MANHKSVQITKLDAVPAERLETHELGGRVRPAYFEFTVPVGNAAIADTVELCELPAGARILGGHFAAEAMSSGGAAASMQLGDGSDPDRFLGTTSIDAAAEGAFAHTIALGYGQRLAAKTRLVATVLTEAWAAGQKLSGHLLYVAD